MSTRVSEEAALSLSVYSAPQLVKMFRVRGQSLETE